MTTTTLSDSSLSSRQLLSPEAPRPCPPRTLAALRLRLQEQREVSVGLVQELSEEAAEIAADRDLSDLLDQESAQGGVLEMEAEWRRLLASAAERNVTEIDQALRRMEAGSYGVCERCGGNISVARLTVIPHTTFCVVCKAQSERGVLAASGR